MFANTETLVWAGSNVTMTRMNQDKYSSEYRGNTAEGAKLKMFIRHSTYFDKKRGVQKDRHNVEVTFTAPTADANGVFTEMKAYNVLDVDSSVSLDGQMVLNKMLNGFLTDAYVTRLANWES